MVVIDKFSKVDDFVVVKSTNSVSEVDQIFIKEIVRLHGVPKKRIDRDTDFTCKFLKELFTWFGIELAFSTTYYPQTYEKIEKKWNPRRHVENVCDALAKEVGRISSTCRVYIQKWVWGVFKDDPIWDIVWKDL